MLVWYSIVQRLLPRARDVELEARTRFGARMHVRFPDTIQSHVFFFGVWEPAITAWITRTLGPGDAVIDIGANIGYDSLLASHLAGATGRVHAIEASPYVHGLLTRDLALNRTANVTPYLVAVCAANGPVPIFLHDARNLGGTTIVPAVAARRGAQLETTMPARPLPAIVPEPVILGARLIKIDVEGAEWPVVRGFAHLLPRLSQQTELLIQVNAEGLRAAILIMAADLSQIVILRRDRRMTIWERSAAIMRIAGLRDHGMTIPAFLDVFRQAGFAAWPTGNRYSVDTYLDPTIAQPERLAGKDFDQLDILFRRE